MNMAYIRQPSPDSGLGFQAKVLKMFRSVPFLLGTDWAEWFGFDRPFTFLDARSLGAQIVFLGP